MSSVFKILKPVIIILMVLLLLPIIMFSVVHAQFGYVSKWKYKVEDFEAHQEDYQKIAQFCLDYIEQHPDDEYIFDYNFNKSEMLFNFQVIEVDDDIKKSFEQIKNSFPSKDAQFDHIRCKDGTVYFMTHNQLYSVVYSPAGKPECMGGITEVDSKKIIGNWYHVVPA